jgi:hypothetical protein
VESYRCIPSRRSHWPHSSASNSRADDTAAVQKFVKEEQHNVFWVFQASYDQLVTDIRGKGIYLWVILDLHIVMDLSALTFPSSRALNTRQLPYFRANAAVAKGKGKAGCADSLEKEFFEVVDVLEVGRDSVCVCVCVCVWSRL